MSMNNQGRPSGAGEAGQAGIATISGDRGLDHEESLIFELGHGAMGVDLPDVKVDDDRLGGMRRKGGIEVQERIVGAGRAVEDLTEEDVLAYLLPELSLILR